MIARVLAATILLASALTAEDGLRTARESCGLVNGTAPGVVVHREGEFAIVATPLRAVLRGSVHVVFAKQPPVAGEVTAFDPDTGLAFVRIPAASAPLAIHLVKEPPREGISATVLGFALAAGAGVGGPAPTTTRVAIASLRKGNDGSVAWIQLDHRALWRDGGGALVDEHGGLIGLVVTSLGDLKISFAVPAALIRQELDGRVSMPVAAVDRCTDNGVSYHVEAFVIDPLGRLKHARLAWSAVEPKALTPPDDGTWTRAVTAGAKEIDLAIDQAIASGKLDLKLPDPGREAHYLLQVHWQERWSAPRRVVLASPPAAVPAGDDWLGGGSPAAPAAGTARAPAKAGGAGGAGAAVGSIAVPGVAIWRPLRDARLSVAVTRAPIVGAGWSADGAAVVALSQAGLLAELVPPAWTPRAAVDVGSPCAALYRTKAGWLVLEQASAKARLYSDALERMGEVTLPTHAQLVASPASDLLVLVVGGKLRSIRLPGGKTVAETSIDTLNEAIRKKEPKALVPLEVASLVASADGRSLYETSNAGVVRFALDQGAATVAAILPLRQGRAMPPGESFDGRRLAVWSEAVEPDPPTYHLVDAATLKVDPKRAIDGAGSAVPPAQVKSGQWLAVNDAYEIGLWDAEGARIADYGRVPDVATMKAAIAHPTAKRWLLIELAALAVIEPCGDDGRFAGEGEVDDAARQRIGSRSLMRDLVAARRRLSAAQGRSFAFLPTNPAERKKVEAEAEHARKEAEAIQVEVDALAKKLAAADASVQAGAAGSSPAR